MMLGHDQANHTRKEDKVIEPEWKKMESKPMVIQSEADLIVLINAGVERPDLDYKEKIYLEGAKKDKAEIAKDIIAIANSGGGFIIGGVKESPNGFLKIGMTPEELACFDSTKLNQFVNAYCDPPINSTTRKVDIDGKVFGVIIVPEFDEQPHIITRSFDQVFNEADIFVRTGNNESRRAGPHELRALVEKCVMRRQGVFQHIIQAALPPTRPQIIDNAPRRDVAAPIDMKKFLEKYKAFRIIQISPIAAPPNIRLRNLKRTIDKACIWDSNSNRVSFPPANPRYASSTSEIRLPIGITYQTDAEDYGIFAFSYFDIHGGIFIAERLWEDNFGNRFGQGPLGIVSCIRTIYESLLFAKLYYGSFDWTGKLAVQFSVESSTPRNLVHDTRNSLPLFRNYQNTMSAPVSAKGEFDTSGGLKEIEELVVEMSLEFFWFFNYDLDEENFQGYMAFLKQDGLYIPDALKTPGGTA